LTLGNTSAVEVVQFPGQRNSGQIWWDHLEAESLQDLDSIIGRALQENPAVGKPSILPLAMLAAITEQTVFKGTVEKKLTVKSYRLLTILLSLDLFHRRSDPLGTRPPRGGESTRIAKW
jgi:hypothetical protein